MFVRISKVFYHVFSHNCLNILLCILFKWTAFKSVILQRIKILIISDIVLQFSDLIKHTKTRSKTPQKSSHEFNNALCRLERHLDEAHQCLTIIQQSSSKGPRLKVTKLLIRPSLVGRGGQSRLNILRPSLVGRGVSSRLNILRSSLVVISDWHLQRGLSWNPRWWVEEFRHVFAAPGDRRRGAACMSMMDYMATTDQSGFWSQITMPLFPVCKLGLFPKNTRLILCNGLLKYQATQWTF